MKTLTRFALTTLLFSLTLFSCTSGSKTDDSGRSRSGDRHAESGDSRSGGGPGQEMPMPTESELTVVRLQSLAETEQVSLTLTREQARIIIPILEKWLETVIEDPDNDTDNFIKQISSELTEEQNEFLPPPPGSVRGEKAEGNRPEGGRPSGGSRPEEMDISELLTKVIKVLKKV